VAAAGGVPVQMHYPSPGASYGASPAVVGAAAAASDIWVACSWNELIYSEAWSAAMAAGTLYVSYGGLDATVSSVAWVRSIRPSWRRWGRS
jgi:hypothetical protein